MYTRLLKLDIRQSAFLLGPRGTGKTSWIKQQLGKGILYLDLLETRLYTQLSADPQRLDTFIPPQFSHYVVLDEVQKIPALLNEVHRLIESRGIRFLLTGSSARSLRKQGVNLLAGRALTYHMYPLTALELGQDFDLARSLQFGHLPSVFSQSNPRHYLESYIGTYLREEVLQEGLLRNASAFSRFLEHASFSQGSLLNMSEIGREIGINRKLIESYFDILEDLLIGYRISVFSKHAKRKLVTHQKFYYFDLGVYRFLRPKGPLDGVEEIEGVALETFVFQELKAINDYFHFGYQLYFWRTHSGIEVDFVLYGEHGLLAFEVKRSNLIHNKDLKNLRAFLEDYPMAKAYLLYGGEHTEYRDNITILPLKQFFPQIKTLLS
jgi:uncharacterized protein